MLVVDGAIADTWSLNWVKLEPGFHNVCFSDVEGFDTPACEVADISAGAVTELTGTFVPRGDLDVTTSPAVASQISVDGVPRNDWGLWAEVAPGTYAVCFGKVAGFNVPAAARMWSRNISASMRLRFIRQYSRFSGSLARCVPSSADDR